MFQIETPGVFKGYLVFPEDVMMTEWMNEYDTGSQGMTP
jgi:hypothetical protein